MKCYEDGWPIEAMARQVLIERRSEAKGTRPRKRGKSSKVVKEKTTGSTSKRKSSPKGEISSEQGRERQRDKQRKREKAHHENRSSRAAVSNQTRLPTPPKKESTTARAGSPTPSVVILSRAQSPDVNMVCFLPRLLSHFEL